MTALEARAQALLMAAAAQVTFRKVRRMDESQMAEGSVGKTAEQMIQALVPFFKGLDALAETVDRQHEPQVVDHVFDVLAHVGNDQARGHGLFANKSLHPKAAVIATLKSPPIARAYAGAAELDGLADTSSMLSAIQSLSSRIEADNQVRPAGELFSAVAKKNKAPDHELVGIYEKVRDEFITLCGDRRVDDYRRKDLQHYVDEISWLAPDASSQKGFSYSHIKMSLDISKPTRWRAGPFRLSCGLDD